MLFLLLFQLSFGEFFIQTEVIAPIGAGNVLQHEQGLLVFDSRDQLFSNYSNTGALLAQFGGKGNAPQQLLRTQNIYEKNGVVYAITPNKVVLYGFNGEFIGTITVPRNKGRMTGCVSGWLENIGLGETALWEEDFSQSKILIPGRQPKTSPKDQINASGESLYDPTKQQFWVRVDKKGEVAYLIDQKDFNVEIYDLATRKRIATYQKHIDKTPFPVKWGEEQMAALQAELKKGPMPDFAPTLKADFPKYMPAVRWTDITPEGHLAVRLWHSNPNLDIGPLYIINKEGKETTSVAYDGVSLRRVVGFLEDKLLVLAQVDEDVAIAKVEPSQLRTFIAENEMQVRPSP